MNNVMKYIIPWVNNTYLRLEKTRYGVLVTQIDREEAMLNEPVFFPSPIIQNKKIV